VIENFFCLEGRNFHEIGLYFRATIAAGLSLPRCETSVPGVDPNVPLVVAWFSRSQLGSIDLRPSFLCNALATPELAFQHVVHREQHAP